MVFAAAEAYAVWAAADPELVVLGPGSLPRPGGAHAAPLCGAAQAQLADPQSHRCGAGMLVNRA